MRFMGLYFKNRPEWVVSDIACALSGITSVPFYGTLGMESIKQILEDTRLEILLCSVEKVPSIL